MLRIPDKQKRAKSTDYNLVIEKHNPGLEPADVDYEWTDFSSVFESMHRTIKFRKLSDVLNLKLVFYIVDDTMFYTKVQ